MRTLLLIVFIFAANIAHSEPLKVLFINPSELHEPFWEEVEKVSRAAAYDLDIDLKVIYGNANRITQLQAVQEALAVQTLPDYAVIMNYPSGAKQLMDLLEAKKVKFFTLEQTIFGEEKARIGEPGKHYKMWLGEIYHDNKRAGALLGTSLLMAQQKAMAKPALAVALSGHHGSESQARLDGLYEAFEGQGVVQQNVYASWSKNIAYRQTQALLKRFPDTNIIWCASDLMAQGAAAAALAEGREINKDIFIGGFDWLFSNIESISSNKMTATVGGHLMMGAWAMLAVKQYHQNPAAWEYSKGRFELELINRDNVKEFLTLFHRVNWQKFDYKHLYSIPYHQLEFSFKQLMEHEKHGSSVVH